MNLHDPGGADAVTTDLHARFAQWAYDKSQPAGVGTDTLPGSRIPLRTAAAPMRTRGVLAVKAAESAAAHGPGAAAAISTLSPP